jgi:copper(I)-binding protein
VRLIALVLILAPIPAAAHEVTTDTLVIDHPYAFETAATAMSGAGFLSITNTGDRPDRLVAVRAAFPRVTLQDTGTAGIDIAPGATVTLAPGGPHVMFVGLDGDPFVEGERIPATLVFEEAGEIAVEFWVEPRDGDAAGHVGEGEILIPGPDKEGAAIAAALQQLLGPGTEPGPFAVEGDVAVAGWRAGGEAGHAFLRRSGDDDWHVQLMSGESLRHAATFRTLGMSPPAAAALERSLAAIAEAQPASWDSYAGFRGTLFLPAP